MSVLDDIGIAVTELTDEVLYPPWLVELAERCRRELDELPPRAQPSWYREQKKRRNWEDA